MGAMIFSATAKNLDLNELCALFSQAFYADYNTILVGGYAEPFYLASKQGSVAEIRFTKDYLRSALHEIAHWCVAGAQRRQQDDFGYWYAPDGRNASQQLIFYQTEVLPQAYEWAFCNALNIEFEVSADNLSGEGVGVEVFKNEVRAKLLHLWQSQTFPPRVNRWIDALLQHYHTQQFFQHNFNQLSFGS
jgi:elongation factor P hydroxylase